MFVYQCMLPAHPAQSPEPLLSAEVMDSLPCPGRERPVRRTTTGGPAGAASSWWPRQNVRRSLEAGIIYLGRLTITGVTYYYVRYLQRNIIDKYLFNIACWSIFFTV